MHPQQDTEAAKKRSRLGVKIRNGNASSITKVAPVAKVSAPAGSARRTSQRGRQRLSQEMIMQSREIPPIGSPLKSLTKPDMNMKRNRSQRSSQMPGVWRSSAGG